MKKKKSPYVKWLLKHILHYRVQFILNIIGIILVVVTRTIIPVKIGDLIDSIIDPGFAGDVLFIILMLFGLYLLRNFTEYGIWMLGHNLGSKTEQRIRREFFESVQNKPLRFHDQVRTGDLQALATNDLRVLNTMISHGSFYIYPFAQSLITVILQAQSFDYRMVLFTTPLLIIYAWTVLQYRKNLMPYSKQALSKHADVTVALQESLTGALVTKAFSAEALEFKKFKKRVTAYRLNWQGENKVQARFYPLLVLYISIGVTFMVSCILVYFDLMTFGELTAVNLLQLTLIEPTNMIFWATKDTIGGFGASERLY
ncbi:MAG: ABC transporter transmembrane domain-containing protein, partial [Promethearchaeota archaeon]